MQRNSSISTKPRITCHATSTSSETARIPVSRHFEVAGLSDEAQKAANEVPDLTDEAPEVVY